MKAAEECRSATAYADPSIYGARARSRAQLLSEQNYSLPDSGVKNTSDTSARFYTLSLPLQQGRLTDPLISDATVLHDSRGEPFTGANFDGEGIALTSEGDLMIVSETEPSIRRFSPDGRLLRELSVPQKFLVAPKGYAQLNGSLESAELSPDGRSLFTANEEPLATDGHSPDEHQLVRLLRYEDRGSSEFEPSEEFFYRTQQRRSISDIAALSEGELLVLERGGRQIFRVSLDGADDVSDEENLSASSAAPLEKELLIDVDDECPLPSGDQDHFGLLEGLVLGPELPSGQRALLVQSDDDFRKDYKTRFIALGI